MSTAQSADGLDAEQVALHPTFIGKHVGLQQKGQKLLLTLELATVESAPSYAVSPINPAAVRASSSAGAERDVKDLCSHSSATTTLTAEQRALIERAAGICHTANYLSTAKELRKLVAAPCITSTGHTA